MYLFLENSSIYKTIHLKTPFRNVSTVLVSAVFLSLKEQKPYVMND